MRSVLNSPRGASHRYFGARWAAWHPVGDSASRLENRDQLTTGATGDPLERTTDDFGLAHGRIGSPVSAMTTAHDRQRRIPREKVSATRRTRGRNCVDQHSDPAPLVPMPSLSHSSVAGTRLDFRSSAVGLLSRRGSMRVVQQVIRLGVAVRRAQRVTDRDYLPPADRPFDNRTPFRDQTSVSFELESGLSGHSKNGSVTSSGSEWTSIGDEFGAVSRSVRPIAFLIISNHITTQPRFVYRNLALL